VYYGAADEVVCAADFSLAAILSSLKYEHAKQVEAGSKTL
jgi:predicted GH43/DUF377 family glycosyl hydrolase